MGYTTQNSGLLVGIGVSSISDAGTAFVQNEKTLRGYYEAINSSRFAIKKGYALNKEDTMFKKNILDITCKGITSFMPTNWLFLRKILFRF